MSDYWFTVATFAWLLFGTPVVTIVLLEALERWGQR